MILTEIPLCLLTLMKCCFLNCFFFSSLFSEGKPDPSGWTSPRFSMFRPDHNGWNPLMVAAHQGTKDPLPDFLSALKIQWRCVSLKG